MCYTVFSAKSYIANYHCNTAPDCPWPFRTPAPPTNDTNTNGKCQTLFNHVLFFQTEGLFTVAKQKLATFNCKFKFNVAGLCFNVACD